MVCLGKPDI